MTSSVMPSTELTLAYAAYQVPLPAPRRSTLKSTPGREHQTAFLAGLLLGGCILNFAAPGLLELSPQPSSVGAPGAETRGVLPADCWPVSL